jgi:hypothetical protein
MTTKLEQPSDAHSMHSTEQQEKKDNLATSASSEDIEYPPFKRVLAIVLGMMSVSLLVALVSIVVSLLTLSGSLGLTIPKGPNHYRNSYTRHHGSLQLAR